MTTSGVGTTNSCWKVHLFTVSGVTFRLSYRCSAEAAPPVCNDPGTGNDIGLTAVSD